MAVDAHELDAVAATVADLYRQAELDLVALIARHLSRGNPEAPGWAQSRLAATRTLLQAADRIVQRLLGDTDGAFRQAAAQAFRSGRAAALVELAGWVDPQLAEQARQATLDELPSWGPVETLASAVHRDVGDKSSNVLRNVNDTYRAVIAAAAGRQLTGQATSREAAQAAYRRLADRGITGFTDSSGRRWQLGTYVEMATRTVAQRAAVEAHTSRLAALGQSLVYVTDHLRECHLCRPFEGKVLSLTGGAGTVTVPHQLTDEPVEVEVEASLVEARARGLFHPNCRHNVNLYLPGVTALPEGTEDRDGDEARQRQRAIERQIRRWKTRQAAALTPEAKRHAGRKVRTWQGVMREHLDAHPDLKRQRHREAPGAGYAPTASATPAGELRPQAPEGTRLPTRADQPAPSPAELGDADLDQAMQDALLTEDFTRFEDLSTEADRRQQRQARLARDRQRRQQRREAEDARKWTQYEQLLEQGVDDEEAVERAFGITVAEQRRDAAVRSLRDAGYRGRGFEELARQSWRAKVHEDYFAAEDETRGVMLTRQGEQRGVDPFDLWERNESYARRWASEELRAWWDAHGRVTYAEWKAQLLGDVQTAGRITSERGDFNT